jgi:DNA replication protein DnaC
MLTNPTLEKLNELKLTGMAAAFADQLAHPAFDLDFEARFGLLVENERATRDNKRLTRLLKQAKLKQSGACIADISCEKTRGIDKAQMIELGYCQWIKQHQNILITGSTGCGKTYIACALANSACAQGFTCRYYRLSLLFEELKIAKATGRYMQLLAQLSKINLLLLDDWGITVPDILQKQELLEIIDARYQKGSTIITSQLDTAHWHTYLAEATLADAILDRLLHNAIYLKLQGESMRRTKLKEQTG